MGHESTNASEYLSLKALAAYSSLSARTLRKALKDPSHPLPHYKPNGKVLVRRSEFDEWIGRYRRDRSLDMSAQLDRVVAAASGDV